MKNQNFAVSFEIVTPGSAAHGDADERGMVSENATLRDAMDDVRGTRTAECGGVESIESCDRNHPRSVTVTNGAEYRTGAQESRTLHVPPNVTRSSARRIARLLGARP